MKWMYKEKLIKIFSNNFNNHNKHVIILIVSMFQWKVREYYFYLDVCECIKGEN